MIHIDEQEFERLVAEAIDNIPAHYAEHIKNLSFVIEDEPAEAQRQKLHLHDGMTLFGLYEGIPLTNRGNNYSGVLPDKITIFRQPMLAAAGNKEQLIQQINNTVWHEVAHYFGLDHIRIDQLENK